MTTSPAIPTTEAEVRERLVAIAMNAMQELLGPWRICDPRPSIDELEKALNFPESGVEFRLEPGGHVMKRTKTVTSTAMVATKIIDAILASFPTLLSPLSEAIPIVHRMCESDPRMESLCGWPECGCAQRGDWPPGEEDPADAMILLERAVEGPWTDVMLTQARALIRAHKAHAVLSPGADRRTADWQPIETAPKDGTQVLIGWYLGNEWTERRDSRGDRTGECVMQFRKKPVVISASQWFKNGDHPLDYAQDEQGFEKGELRTFTGVERKTNGWEGGVVRYFRRPDVDGTRGCRHCIHTMHEHGWIDTKEGGHVVCPGDWIITGVQGEHYPCKPDIFAATYEPVEQEKANG